ncbi:MULTISPECIES: DedA family protein [unclassified Streptomyces]|uniref:DedA family protein n=1 Tax=unclassified Streptomyces TaxID=2593676 RepID=UPI003D8B87AF
MVNATWLLSTFGAFGVLVCIFAETGLLVVGFFLPGDTLLVPAGLLCASTARSGPHLPLLPVLACAAAGTIAGAQVGFWTGRRAGRAALARVGNQRLRAGADRAERLLARYGYAKAAVLGRFIPVVRTVLNPVAGALGVPVRAFTLWQAIGGLAWSQSLVLGGYWLGDSVRHPDAYLVPAVATVVVASLVPVALEVLRGRRTERADRDTPADV